MLSYMLPTGNKPPPGEPSQNCSRTTKLSNRNDMSHQQLSSTLRNSTARQNIIDSPGGRTMTTTSSMTMNSSSPPSRIENEINDVRSQQNDTRLESPKHINGNAGIINSNMTTNTTSTTTTTTRKSTLHTSSRVTKDDSLHSIDSEASTVGSDRKSKIINGAKHASLKRVSFGSSKGSMVETLVYETPVQEEPEMNHFMDHNGRLPAPMIPVPDTEGGRARFGCERIKKLPPQRRKRRAKMPKPKGIIHALVLWGKTAEEKKNRDTRRLCDVIELASIPRKFRKEGATPMLKWMDKKTRKASLNKATVIKISDNVEELERISMGMTGAASDSTEKLFGSDVLHKRKELQQAKRRAKSAHSKVCHGTDLLPTSPVPSEEDNNDDEAEDTESKTQRFMNAMKELASQVTDENIRFLEAVVDVMKASNLAADKSETKPKPPYKVPDFYTTPGRGKVPIWEGMDFYLYEGVKTSIETKSHMTDKTTGERLRHWPLLVRLTLTEIYGKRLADHSAKGSKSGSRPAIDHRLFRAIHYWASDWVGHEVDVDAYVDHINKTCYNKRKCMPRDIKKRVQKSAAKDSPKETANKVTAGSSSDIQTMDAEQTSSELRNQAPSVSNAMPNPQTNQYPNSIWDESECNFASLIEGREKVRVAFLGPTPSPATPGVLLLEPLLPSGHLIDGMSASPAELLTTHTEHTSPAYHAQISTDSGWDNPFRPDGDLSREADEIVELIKGGKPITPTPGQNAPPLPGCEATGKPIEGDLLDSSTSPLLNASANSTGRPGDLGRLNQGNGNAHGTPGKPGNANSATKQQPVNEKVGQATTATVEVGRVTAQGPGDASQVEHVTLKKKPKCKCCVLQ